jgi:hypothetical protein
LVLSEFQYQVVRPQAGEHECQLVARQDAAGADGRLARGDAGLVDEQADLARLGEIEHGGKKGGARNQRVLFLG